MPYVQRLLARYHKHQHLQITLVSLLSIVKYI